ncbi:YciI family protein [Amycolatopsis palatopharyngis]|uniref:YciI family protein n=1 Tax=Amycolatopsis palatopharyngis TaxID=187982 RepID=UPI000E256C8B|nr:YciI family protein [Amycolatopsis palatopharyngis]
MRFMMIVKASADSESGVLPTEEELNDMGKFNAELVKSGVMLAGDGLQPSSKGARVTFSGKEATVTDGPFTEAKELIAGFWIIDVKSKDEAIEWARRVPFVDGEVEVRQVFETEDFAEVMSPELQEAENKLRAQVAAQNS